MSIKVEIIGDDGNKQAFKSSSKLAARTRFGIEKAFYFIGKDLISEFSRQVLAKDKTGRLYLINRNGRRRRHLASAPGETPANFTGRYRKGAGFIVGSSNQLIFGNSTEYALPLETGTRFMKKRPGLGNAVKASERSTIDSLAGNIEERL